MNQRTRVLLASFVALLLMGLAVMIFVHYSGRDDYKLTLIETSGVGLDVKNIHYSGTKAGRLEWELYADSATRLKGSEQVALENVRGLFYSMDGHRYVMRSAKAVIDETVGVVDAAGGVTIDSKDGTLKTRTARYLIKSKRITAGGFVEMTSGKMSVTGTGLDADIEKDTVELQSGVRAVITNEVN
ncbi:MAG: LPS export ABC transporter periplasmic protein LptC [Deltaproteobacteria bacterium]|nr:LPS export ABC transporter periplasmic protein LptC [Deltaproteobacteria bacterium]